MKKIIFFAAFVFCSLVMFNANAQDNEVLVNTLKTCVTDGTSIKLPNQYIAIDTTFVCGDSLRYTSYTENGDFKYSFPITRVDNFGSKCVYHCNPNGNIESASLTVYTEICHDNAYDNQQCHYYIEQYGILRRRTNYGYVQHAFKFF